MTDEEKFMGMAAHLHKPDGEGGLQTAWQKEMFIAFIFLPVIQTETVKPGEIQFPSI